MSISSASCYRLYIYIYIENTCLSIYLICFFTLLLLLELFIWHWNVTFPWFVFELRTLVFAFLKLEFFCLFSRWKDYPTNKFLFIVLYIYYWVGSPNPCVLFLHDPFKFLDFFYFLLPVAVLNNFLSICTILLLLLQVVYISLLRKKYCMFHNETK